MASAQINGISLQWGHLAPDPDENEEYYEDVICDYVYSLFYYSNSYCTPFDAYGASTTSYYVGTCMNYQNNPSNGIDYVTNWWVGDFKPSASQVPAPFGHLWFHGANGDDISDDFVYDHSATYSSPPSKQAFNFI